MMRFLIAFAWLRWRLMANGLRGGRRRDTLERVSRMMAVVVPFVLGLVLVGLASSAGVLGFIGGRKVGQGMADPAGVFVAFRVVLLIVLLLLVLVPLGASSHRSLTGTTRLRLLPISRRALHFVEVITTLADPWVVFVVPGVVLFAAGLSVAGRHGAALVALAAALAMIFLLASVGCLVTSLMSWLMKNRRRGEMFTLVFVLAISVVAVLPAMFGDSIEARLRLKKSARAVPSAARVDDAPLPAWTRAIPSELYGRSVRAAVDRESGAAWLQVGCLLLEAAAVYALSAAAHKKLIEATESGRTRRRSPLAHAGAFRIPLLGPATSAVSLVHARNALRSVRGRIIVLLPAPLIVVCGVVSRRVPGELPGGTLLMTEGHVLLSGGIVFTLYALLAFTMNQFGADRAGLTLQFLAPITDRQLVRGKAVGGAFIFALTMCFCLIASLAVGWGGPLFTWIAVLLGGAATYVLMCPIAAWMSAVFPVASDLSKTGNGGNPHGLAMLVGTLVVLALSVPPAVIVGVSYHLYRRADLAFVLMLLWFALALVASVPLLGVAARAVDPRRENIALVAQGR